MAISVLALAGDHYHPAEPVIRRLEAAAQEQGWTTTVHRTPDAINWARLDDYDLFFLSAWGLKDEKRRDVYWIDPATEALIADFVRAGGGLLVHHSGLASYPKEGPLRRIVGGAFTHHPEKHPRITVTVARPAHPLAAQVSVFEIVDEQYFVEVDAAETTIVLVGMSAEHGASPAAWAHSVGAGRVCAVTPGHDEETLANPQLARLISNGVLWAARRR